MAKISCHHVWKIFGPKGKKNQKRPLQQDKLIPKAGHVVAVKDVSFEVEPGEIFVVMGLSGSGKSTLVRCLIRLIEPSSGQVLINGQNVLTMNRAELRNLRLHHISMVFQQFGLFPHRRVIDNVAYGLEVQRVNKKARLKRANEMLELVGLEGWGHYFPRELSGGMQQRVGLARALAVNPEILLFDEPFSSLDPLIRREMQDELLRLQAQMQKTVIFITHDFSEAVKLGNRIAIMKEGQIVQLGTPETIVTQPADDYVRAFTRDIPRAKVLTACNIMQPYQNISVSACSCTPTTKVEALIPLVLASDAPIVVLDERQQPIGQIDRRA
ncbi:MAG: glycine betaine/L-proline ABC transporter ATP-binding protein, partial [Chloroflexi bacterium]